MAMINVNRGAESLGVFSEEDVRAGLRTGRFAPTDLGWREGMTSWQALSQFPEFAEAIGVAPSSAGATVAPGEAIAVTAVARSGLPWENRPQLGLVKAFTDTLMMVLTKPAEAFQLMKTEGGLVEPLIYAVIGGSLGFIVYCLFTFAFGSFGMMGNRGNPFGAMFAGMGLVFMIILAPVFVAVGMFIGAGIIHVCLMLVGGAKRSFETTFRVICFASGSAQPLLVIPFCGGLISGIWGIVAECIGLAKAHETDLGRAVLAVVLPVIICCGGSFLFGMIVGLGAMGAPR